MNNLRWTLTLPGITIEWCCNSMKGAIEKTVLKQFYEIMELKNSEPVLWHVEDLIVFDQAIDN